MEGAYHLADEISNTFYSFLLNIFLSISGILPLDTSSAESTKAWGRSDSDLTLNNW
jgi:hypothetical protein